MRSRDQIQQKWQPNEWAGVTIDATDAVETMIYFCCKIQFFIFVTAGYIQRKLTMNEKQGPNTIEMAAKSVSWSHDWCYRCCRNYDILLLQNTIFHIRHRRIHTKETNNEREAGTKYNRNGSQMSELESRLMLQMLSKLWYTSVAKYNFSYSSPPDPYKGN
jgi:hypothetical protein